MIIDKLENWEHYYFGPGWKRAFEFLMSLNPESDEKKYNIQGDDIFALIMSYETCTPEKPVFETHQKYVDIQTVLIGGEGIEWFSRDGLVVDTPYDDSKDVQFYKCTMLGPARVDVFPGTFVMLFPQDAHMPALMIEEKPELIKKVVVKINLELLTAEIKQR